jgi:hypothetical protein
VQHHLHAQSLHLQASNVDVDGAAAHYHDHNQIKEKKSIKKCRGLKIVFKRLYITTRVNISLLFHHINQHHRRLNIPNLLMK